MADTTPPPRDRWARFLYSLAGFAIGAAAIAATAAAAIWMASTNR